GKLLHGHDTGGIDSHLVYLCQAGDLAARRNEAIGCRSMVFHREIAGGHLGPCRRSARPGMDDFYIASLELMPPKRVGHGERQRQDEGGDAQTPPERTDAIERIVERRRSRERAVSSLHLDSSQWRPGRKRQWADDHDEWMGAAGLSAPRHCSIRS